MEANNALSISRTETLITERTRKLAAPYVTSTVCSSLVSFVNSLIAGRGLGSEMLAAVTAAAPLLAIMQVFHCLIGFGIDKLMIHEIGKGDRRRANRIFGAVLVAVIVLCSAVSALSLLLEPQLLKALQIDPELHEAVLAYSRPILATFPLSEACLCMERAFRTDGRARLLSARGIVSSVLNVALGLVFVAVLHMGITSLAYATVISTFLGYVIPLSHFFSKKRTVSPDFSVMRSFKEFWSIIRKDMRIGLAATEDEVLEYIQSLLLVAVISSVGGTEGLAIWGIFSAIQKMMISIYNGIGSSVSLHSGLMLGEKNYDSIRTSVRFGSLMALFVGIGSALLIGTFARIITNVYQIAPEARDLCMQCLLMGCFVLPSSAFPTILSLYLPSVNKPGLANLMVLIQKGINIGAVMLGWLAGFKGLFICLAAAGWLGTLIQFVFIRLNGTWFVPEKNAENVRAYSLKINPQMISAVTADILKIDDNDLFTPEVKNKVAVLAEESLSNIQRQNKREVLADMDINASRYDISIRIIDTGKAFNPFQEYDMPERSKLERLEEILMIRLSDEAGYDRVLDMNHTTFTLSTD